MSDEKPIVEIDEDGKLPEAKGTFQDVPNEDAEVEA